MAHTRSGCRGGCAHVGVVLLLIVQMRQRMLAVSKAEEEAVARLHRLVRDVGKPSVRVDVRMRPKQNEDAMR